MMVKALLAGARLAAALLVKCPASQGSGGQSKSRQGQTRHDFARPAPPGPTGDEQSQAPQVTPQTAELPSYPAEQIQAGQALFSAQCSFCHGRDAGGGEGGPDLLASLLVAQDVHGDKIGPIVRNGRPDKGMPSFNLADKPLAAIVAFIHDRKAKAKEGRRRTVDLLISRPDAYGIFRSRSTVLLAGRALITESSARRPSLAIPSVVLSHFEPATVQHCGTPPSGV